jgi:methenyltetrahydromethanopterin cyclohydrolase
MGRTNDAILYAGTVHFQVNYGDDKDLERIVNMAPSSASPLIRKAKGLAKRSPSFLEILKDASYDFYKIDPNVFAPAIIIVNNIKTGRVFKAGSFEIDVLKASVKLE